MQYRVTCLAPEFGQIAAFILFDASDARPLLRLIFEPEGDSGIRWMGREIVSDPATKPWISQVLVSWALRRIEEELREGAIPIPERVDPSELDDIPYRAMNALHDRKLDALAAAKLEKHSVSSPDRASLYALMDQKPCAFRVLEAEGPFCVVADAGHPYAIGRGERRLTPTSGPQCMACQLPDTYSTCSHLVHPTVEPVPDNTGVRKVSRADCDRGRKEIASPSECRSGKNACWERLVNVEPRTAAAIVPPRALAESLDQLDTTWRLAYGEPVLRVRSAATIAKLLEPCPTKAEFESHLSAVGDTLKALVIPDKLLPPQPKPLPGDATFDRLQASLLARPNIDQNRVMAAIGRLRAIVRIRNSQQHYGTKQNPVEAAAALGISYPPVSWQSAWDQLRSQAVEALWDLSDELRRSVVNLP